MSERPPLPGLALVVAIAAACLACMVWRAATGARLADPAAREASGAEGPPWPQMRIDLNSAPAAELEVLPGLGERLAERIVADRDARGPFASLADLGRVPGIGRKTILRISPYAVVEPRYAAAEELADP